MDLRLRILLSVLLPWGAAFGATLRVPSQYARIYEALDAAASGDPVLVAPGTGYGGAVGCGNSQVRDCLFVENSSAIGGGGIAAGVGFSTVERCTFVGNHVDPGNFGGAAIRATSTSMLTLRNNVITGSWGATAVGRGANASITSSCSVFWENVDGDWSGFTPDSTDRVLDPQFCDPVAGDYTVRSTSPCLPENSLGCGQIGAFGQGCGVISIDTKTWAEIKARFREEGTSAGGEKP